VEIEEEEATDSPLLCYAPTLLDDLIRGEGEDSEEEDVEDIFAYDEEEIPVTLKALFSDAYRFNSVLSQHTKGKQKRVAKRARIAQDAEKIKE